MHNNVMDRIRRGFTETYEHSLSVVVTLTFDLATWFLFTTHRFVMMIICAKLFSNPTMHNKVMSRTQTSFTEVYEQS